MSFRRSIGQAIRWFTDAAEEPPVTLDQEAFRAQYVELLCENARN
jgi:hypothetical protein